MIDINVEQFIDDTSLIPMIYVDPCDSAISQALSQCGMESTPTKPNYWVQTRGGLDLPNLAKKMKKLGYRIVEVIGLIPDVINLPPNLYPNYIHFPAGTLIDTITLQYPNGQDVIAVYDYKGFAYAYELLTRYVVKNSRIIVEISEYAPLFIWDENLPTQQSTTFLTQHPEYNGKLKQPVRRTYHTFRII